MSRPVEDELRDFLIGEKVVPPHLQKNGVVVLPAGLVARAISQIRQLKMRCLGPIGCDCSFLDDTNPDSMVFELTEENE